MSQTDTLYQQLRSHLAYLKLGAAAEALPAALDTARTDKQNPTEFLEQLLRVEVDATEARRLKGRQRFANIPTPWRLTDFDFTAQPSVDEALVRDLGTGRYIVEIRRNGRLEKRYEPTLCELDDGVMLGRIIRLADSDELQRQREQRRREDYR